MKACTQCEITFTNEMKWQFPVFCLIMLSSRMVGQGALSSWHPNAMAFPLHLLGLSIANLNSAPAKLGAIMRHCPAKTQWILCFATLFHATRRELSKAHLSKHSSSAKWMCAKPLDLPVSLSVCRRTLVTLQSSKSLRSSEECTSKPMLPTYATG